VTRFAAIMVPTNQGVKSVKADFQSPRLQSMMPIAVSAVTPLLVPYIWKDHLGMRRLSGAASKPMPIAEANIAANTNQSCATNGKMAGRDITSSALRQKYRRVFNAMGPLLSGTTSGLSGVAVLSSVRIISICLP